MKPVQGYIHAGVVALAVWFCRETIFEALQWWYGRPPSDGLLLGFCILLTGLACVPIVALHFSHAMVTNTFLYFIFGHPLYMCLCVHRIAIMFFVLCSWLKDVWCW